VSTSAQSTSIRTSCDEPIFVGLVKSTFFVGHVMLACDDPTFFFGLIWITSTSTSTFGFLGTTFFPLYSSTGIST